MMFRFFCLVLIFLISSSLTLTAQNNFLLKYSFSNSQLDTIMLDDFDESIVSGRTSFYTGLHNDELAELPSEIPVDNLFEGSDYRFPAPAQDEFDVTSYPLRTAVRLSLGKVDSVESTCSGIMISRNHILTAAHCVLEIGESLPSTDFITASPAFDNGEPNALFNSHPAKSIYFFPEWRIDGSDIAILEVEDEPGEITGWVSIGFDEDENLVGELYHKFSYPGTNNFTPSTVEYNGDTLYHSFGIVDNAGDTYLSVTNTYGHSGESGSPFLRVDDRSSYTAYGVMTWSNRLQHTKITPAFFHAFKEVIRDDSTSNDIPKADEITFSVFPNPFIYNFGWNIEGHDGPYDLKLYSVDGRLVDVINNYAPLPVGVHIHNFDSPRLRVDDLLSGPYIFVIESEGVRLGQRLLIKGY